MPSEELYDIIQVKEKPLVTARAVRNVQYQQNSASEPLPTRLPKSNRAPAVSNVDKSRDFFYLGPKNPGVYSLC